MILSGVNLAPRRMLTAVAAVVEEFRSANCFPGCWSSDCSGLEFQSADSRFRSEAECYPWADSPLKA